MSELTDLDTKLNNKKYEMLEVRKSTILATAETSGTYIIQIDKTVFWVLAFIINYPMLSDFAKWVYKIWTLL